MKLLQCGILMSLASIVLAPHSVAAQTITAATAAPGVIPANSTTDITFNATIEGRPTLVELSYLNGPEGHPVVMGQLRKCRDRDDDRDQADGDRDRGCDKHDGYTLSKGFSFPAGQAQFQISATGSQGQVLSPVVLVLSVTTPAGFTINTATLKLGGPLDFTNFNGQYLHGGFAPPGGAEIDIAKEPLPPPPLNNLIDIELANEGSSITSRPSLTVSGISCTQVIYTNNISIPMTNNETVYCESGNTLYKLFLT